MMIKMKLMALVMATDNLCIFKALSLSSRDQMHHEIPQGQAAHPGHTSDPAFTCR